MQTQQSRLAITQPDIKWLHNLLAIAKYTNIVLNRMYGKTDTHSNNLSHLVGFDNVVAVDVVHAKCPGKLLLGRAHRRDVDGEHELGEVDVAVVVRVKRTEHVFAELQRVVDFILTGKQLCVDLDELLSSQLPARTILLQEHQHSTVSLAHIQPIHNVTNRKHQPNVNHESGMSIILATNSISVCVLGKPKN